MFKPIHLRVDLTPIATPRQRMTIINGKVKNYTPKKHPVNVFKVAIQFVAKQEYRGPVLDEPLSVKIVAVFPRPSNLIWKNKEMPRIPKSSTPDADNVTKSVLDALNGVLFRDDALVCKLVFEKYIASGSESSHVFIVVEPIGE